LRLVGAYRSINYQEDAREACDRLRRSYPGDPQVAQLCGPAPVADSKTP
jgi:hypothetical protein